MNYSENLRLQISRQVQNWAKKNNLPYYLSLGRHPTVVFEEDVNANLHGNFNLESWRAIMANPLWRARLDKQHPRKDALPQGKRNNAKELDSSNSSDALLLNIFCFPGALARLSNVMGCTQPSEFPQFGFKARVHLHGMTSDSTEIDMKWRDVLVESKLTETDFTQKEKAIVSKY